MDSSSAISPVTVIHSHQQMTSRDDTSVTSLVSPLVEQWWKEHHLLSHQSSPSSPMPDPPPLIIAVFGLQGSGKSTLVQSLSDSGHLRIESLSLDDFYLPYSEQCQLAATQCPGNPLLELRGNPGTHDLSLLVKCLKDIKAGRPATIPHYDKALRGGRGDTVPEQTRLLLPPIDVLILEGWCLGFRPPPNTHTLLESAATPRYTSTQLAQLIPFVTAYQTQLEPFYDHLIHLDALDISYTYSWREQQERTRNKSALSTGQVRDFVDRFMPLYRVCLPALRPGDTAYSPFFAGRAVGEHHHHVRLVLDVNRQVHEIQHLS